MRNYHSTLECLSIVTFHTWHVLALSASGFEVSVFQLEVLIELWQPVVDFFNSQKSIQLPINSAFGNLGRFYKYSILNEYNDGVPVCKIELKTVGIKFLCSLLA